MTRRSNDEDRREFLLGSIGGGIAAAYHSAFAAAQEDESIRAMLKQTVGATRKSLAWLPSLSMNAAYAITLVNLVCYTSGLPNMPDNLPPKWWTLPNPMVDPGQLVFFLQYRRHTVMHLRH